MTTETWRPWPHLAGVEASNLGRVRRGGRVLVPRAAMAYAPGAVKPSMYPKVRVRRDDGTRWAVAVHRIVCDAWLGHCPDGWHRAHLSGDPNDNRVVNLAIVPARENLREHRIAQGLSPIYKLSEADIERALARYAQPGVRCSHIDREFGLSAGGWHYHAERLGVLKRRNRRNRAVPSSVREAIKADRAQGAKLAEITERHGVSETTAGRIVGRRPRGPKLKGERLEEVRKAALEMTPQELAQRFGIPRPTAYYHHRRAHDAQANPA